MTDVTERRGNAAQADSALQVKVMDTLLHGAFGLLGNQQREHVLHCPARKLQRLAKAETNLTLPELAAMARKADLPAPLVLNMAEAGLAPRQVRALSEEADAINTAIQDLLALSPGQRARIIQQITALRASSSIPSDPYSSSGDDLA